MSEHPAFMRPLSGLNLPTAEGLEMARGRSCTNIDPGPPHGGRPASGRIGAFDEFKLRSAVELNALKLYFLVAARRNRETNMAHISLDKIEDYADVKRHRIKASLTILAINNLAHVERVPSTSNPMGVANAYRLVGLECYNHMGTKGRGIDAAITAFNDADLDEVVSSF
ncbi:hypothetical protein J4G37_23155 [Microvirga sp. 3-52]|nr:hypothetical protein [Microvirga sp. 3-52]